MKAACLDLSLVAFCWFLALVLPHFQAAPSAAEILADIIIICVLGFFIYQVLISTLNNSKLLKSVFALLSIGGFTIGFIWFELSGSYFYEYWSHLGAGTLKSDQNVVFFGDLAHLTAAAKCSRPIIIGTDVCDPWGRLFNQNPDIGELFRSLKLTNLNLIGLSMTLAFLIVFLYAIKFFKAETLGPYVVLLTPMFVLALDRGNEIITVTLLTLSIIFFQKEGRFQQFIASILLISAVLLKLWPIFFIFFLLANQWSRIRVSSRVLLLTPFIYWGVKIHEIQEIMRATQSGSPFGTSFGLKLFVSPQLNFNQTCVLIFVTFALLMILVQLGRKSLVEFVNSESGMDALLWIAPLMLTYFAIWAFGDNFIYRMIILMPLVLILSSKAVFELRWSRFALSTILVTLITGRLPVTIAASSALALYFIYVLFMISSDRTFRSRRK